MNLKQYLFSLKKLILVSSLIFVFFAFNGYFSAQTSPEEAELLFGKLGEMLEPVDELPVFGQFLFIVLNNGITLFLVIVLGLAFGIFPFLVLFSNAMLLGIVAYFSPWSVFLIGIIPHGIIEIPAIILGSAVGFKLAKTVFFKIAKKTDISIKQELNTALIFFLKFLLPFLVLAAAIETFITARLLL